ncbi:MAG: Ig-like domain-containing protein, partial [Chthoniobacterales bacterium]
QAAEGGVVALTFFEDAVFNGRIAGRWQDQSGVRVAARLEGKGPRDRFFMSWSKDGVARGLVELPSINRAYEIVRNADGTYAVREWLYTDVVCATPLPGGSSADAGIPKPDSVDTASAREVRIAPGQVPLLQSRPGLAAVLYMDFDGETVTGTAWSTGSIIAPAARLTAAQITEVWQRVSRDFAPYSVNVTTDRSIYNSAPANRRTHCVVTANDAAAPGAGGVAYLDSFTNSDPAYKICWSFIDNDARDCAVVISHEVGHTLDLSHDGRAAAGSSPREEYYRGHGSGVTGWAPVMGVGYYQNLVQWSKGEYTRANNPEDDLAIITAAQRIPYIADDHGGTALTATTLVKGVATDGLVERTAEQDWFAVDLGAGPQPVSVSLPVGTMLDVELKVFAEDGTTLLETVNPTNALPASTSLNFPSARKVLLSVSGTGKPEVTGTGYSSYSSLGSYTLVAGTPDPVNPPPQVRVTAPANGAVVLPGSTIVVRATASDLNINGAAGNVERLEFLINGNLTASLGAPPYEFSWTPPDGTHSIQARATDDEGEAGLSATVDIEVRLPRPGESNPAFVSPSADNVVRALSSDGLGRIYIGGTFTALDGTFSAPRVARLLPSGTPDPAFFVGTGFNADVRVLLHSESARGLYVGGAFATYQGQPRVALARLTVGQTGLADALPDAAFAPVLAGVNPVVNAIVEQYDGKIVIGGSFSSVNGTSTPNLARLNADGSVDTTFTPPAPSGTVNALALQSDGKVLLGGAFTQVAGQSRRGLARLNLDGTLDTAFIVGTGVNGTVNSVAVAPDGGIFAGGQFSSYNGRTFYNNLVKLSTAGTLDGRFNYAMDSSGGLNGAVNNVQVRPTGEVLVTGLFTQASNSVLPVAATTLGRIVQLRPDGSIDPGFNAGGTGANNTVHNAATMGNGDLVLVGAFGSFNDLPVSRIAVLAGTDGVVPLLTSGQFRTVGAGGDMDFVFTSSSVPGPVEYELISGTLPRGVTFDPATGRLSGIPLDPGSFALGIRPRQTPSGPTGPTVTFTLHVLSATVPYEVWRKVWFAGANLANDAVSGPLAPAPGLPGVANLVVYALSGGNPADPASTQMPSARPEWHGGKIYWTYSIPKYRLAAATYTPQISENLGAWFAETPNAPDTSKLVTLENNVDSLRVRATTPVPQARQQFFRLQIVTP